MKSRLLSMMLFLTAFGVHAQPLVEWRLKCFLDMGPDGVMHDQRHNSQDWWYDITPAYMHPTMNMDFMGYVAVGYCNIRNYPPAADFNYDETLTSHPGYATYGRGCWADYTQHPSTAAGYDCGSLENLTTGRIGPTFSTFALITPSGKTMWHNFLNAGVALNKVIQLSNGDFICVGATAATRKRDTGPNPGTPLYYNPTAANPGDYFVYEDIYTGGVPSGFGSARWNIMRCDMDGNVVFDNIYGPNDFSVSSGVTYPFDPSTSVALTAKQGAFIVDGEAYDLVELNSGNVLVVGFAKDLGSYTVSGIKYFSRRPFAVVVSPNGEVVSKKFLFPSSGLMANSLDGHAYAVRHAMVGGVEKIYIGMRKGQGGQLPEVLLCQYDASTFETANAYVAPNWQASVSSNPSAPSTGIAGWGMALNNAGDVMLPTIRNCNGCEYSGDNYGELTVYRFNGSTGSSLSNNMIRNVHAYDLRAGIVHLSGGGFGVVSSVLDVPWASGCGNSSILPYMYDCGTGFGTWWWNSDTYVAKLDENGNKIWETSFDTDDAYTCTDYPTATESGGNVKRQECMYNIVEAEDGGLVVCGNNSANFDDNYTAKLFNECEAGIAYDIEDATDNTYDITGTVTWNTSLKVLGKVVIKNGASLTITGNTTVIEFADSRAYGYPTSIIVEAGGVLNVGGGATLTALNSCGGTRMWNGIEVQGDMAFAQKITGVSDVRHGVCNIGQNATIAKARTGVFNSVTVNGDGSSLDWAKMGGGIIRCTNANFINCQVGARFVTYQNTNAGGVNISDMSFFKSCKFYTNSATAADGFVPEAHVSMWNTYNITFAKNIFENQTPNDYYGAERGAGIVSWDAGYLVGAACLVVSTGGQCVGWDTPNTFTNLTYGVNAGASFANRLVTVSNTVFNNNHRAIVLRGTNGSKVLRNTVNVGNPYVVPTNMQTVQINTGIAVAQPYGLYLDGCDGYAVEENTFSNADNPNNFDYGIIVNASGTNANEIKQNHFDHLRYGIQAQDVNDGLQLKCNTFAANTISYADISVVRGSIAPQQGACTASETTLPGNEFSHTCGGAQVLLGDLMTVPVDYNTRTAPAVEMPVTGCYDAANFTIWPCTVGTGAACPPPGPGGPGGHMRIREQMSGTAEKISVLGGLVDGGNNPMFYDRIAEGNDVSVRELLTGNGGYLSDGVLLAFVANAGFFSATTIREVIVQNSPLTTNVRAQVDKLSLPEEARAAINAAQIGVSRRTSTERELSYENSQLRILYQDLLDEIRYGDYENKPGMLAENMDYGISPGSRDIYIAALMDNGRYTDASSEIEKLALYDHAAAGYLNCVLAIRSATYPLEPYNSDENIRVTVNGLRRFQGGLATNAKVLYTALFKVPYEEVIYTVDEKKSAPVTAVAVDNPPASDVASAPGVWVYPNPAMDELFFSFTGQSGQTYTVTLYDLGGRAVRVMRFAGNSQPQRTDISDLKNGTYFYTVTGAGKTVGNGKVVVIR